MASNAQQRVDFAIESPAEQPMTIQRKRIVRVAVTMGLVAAVAVISFYGGMRMATPCAAKNQDGANALGKFVPVPKTHAVQANAAMSINDKALERPTNVRGPRLQTSMQMMGDSEDAFGGQPDSWTHCSRRNSLMKAAAAAAALAGVAPPAFAGATQSVKMGSDSGQLAFVPPEVSVCKGDSVSWVMNKAGPHNVVFDGEEVPEGVDAEKLGMPSGTYLSEEGKTFAVKFDKEGEYVYFCEPHVGGGMKGVVNVKA